MGQARVTIDGPLAMGRLVPIRAAVSEYALATGLSPQVASLFVVAVSEALNNVILYAKGQGGLVLSDQDGACVAEIRDRGPGFVEPDDPRLPGPDATHGRGLWLMRRCVDHVTITSRPGATVVRLASLTY